MDLITRIHDYVNLQVLLITCLKDSLGPRDWTYLLDVPRQGAINPAGEEWKYFRHGTGIRFERQGIVVDANRHLEADPATFDVGRLVDYLSSLGDSAVLVDGRMHEFDYHSGPELLQPLIEQGVVEQMPQLVGEIYILST